MLAWWLPGVLQGLMKPFEKLGYCQAFGLVLDEGFQDCGDLSELDTNIHISRHVLWYLLAVSLLILTLQLSSEYKSPYCAV